MKESNVRSMLKEKWSPFADVCPIENSVGAGIPDVNVAYGGNDLWVEIKYRADSPKRDKAPVMKGFLRPQQKIWMRKRLDKGSRNVFLFARIEDEFFCYHISDLDSLAAIETLSLDELYIASCWYGKTRSTLESDWEACLKTMAHKSKV